MCPFCQEPNNLVDDDDVALTYYAKLDLLLKVGDDDDDFEDYDDDYLYVNG